MSVSRPAPKPTEGNCLPSGESKGKKRRRKKRKRMNRVLDLLPRNRDAMGKEEEERIEGGKALLRQYEPGMNRRILVWRSQFHSHL